MIWPHEWNLHWSSVDSMHLVFTTTTSTDQVQGAVAFVIFVSVLLSWASHRKSSPALRAACVAGWGGSFSWVFQGSRHLNRKDNSENVSLNLSSCPLGTQSLKLKIRKGLNIVSYRRCSSANGHCHVTIRLQQVSLFWKKCPHEVFSSFWSKTKTVVGCWF